jgi:cytosine/uracil/thiamine/allantoin permease
MKVTKQFRNFLTLMTTTVATVFLMFIAFTMFYDGMHPSSAFTALIVATAFVFAYSIIIGVIGVKKWIRKIG